MPDHNHKPEQALNSNIKKRRCCLWYFLGIRKVALVALRVLSLKRSTADAFAVPFKAPTNLRQKLFDKQLIFEFCSSTLLPRAAPFKVGTHDRTSPCNKSQVLVASCELGIFATISSRRDQHSNWFEFVVLVDQSWSPRLNFKARMACSHDGT